MPGTQQVLIYVELISEWMKIIELDVHQDSGKEKTDFSSRRQGLNGIDKRGICS